MSTHLDLTGIGELNGILFSVTDVSSDRGNIHSFLPINGDGGTEPEDYTNSGIRSRKLEPSV